MKLFEKEVNVVKSVESDATLLTSGRQAREVATFSSLIGLKRAAPRRSFAYENTLANSTKSVQCKCAGKEEISDPLLTPEYLSSRLKGILSQDMSTNAWINNGLAGRQQSTPSTAEEPSTPSFNAQETKDMLKKGISVPTLDYSEVTIC